MKLDESPATDLPAIERIRTRFPSLQGDTAFFDGPAGSEMPRPVIEAIAAYLREANVNGHAPYRESARSDETASSARDAAAAFFGASPDEVCFGLNATSLNYALSRTAARDLAPGDEVIVTRLDHSANIAPWQALAEDRGLVVRFLDIGDDTRLDLDELTRTLSERTRIVAFPAASNAVGTHTDAATISRLAHEAGALSWFDATHYVPHAPVDLQAVDADVLICSAYKFFGPHLGVAVVRADLLRRWRPYSFGTDGTTAEALETGTLPYESLAGLTATFDYIDSIGWPAIQAQERLLGERFLAGLPASYRLHGLPTMDGRTATFAITPARLAPEALAQSLAEQRIAVRVGHFHAPVTLKRLGLDTAVRIGFLHYNTTDEIDRLLEALARLESESEAT